MSDREHSPSHSGSNHSPTANDKTPTPPNSREQSRSRSRSYSQHRSHHKGKSYSRSRSHSRPRKMSYRGRYRSRSRSRSPRRYKSRYSHSRSRSYSPRGKYYGYSDRRKEFYRSHSRSPMSSRRRHIGSRGGAGRRGRSSWTAVESGVLRGGTTSAISSRADTTHSIRASYQSSSVVEMTHGSNKENPQPSRCLGIFGLSIYTTEQQLHHIMSKYGPVERVQVVIDAKTGRSRGFSFVYFESAEDAKVAKEQCTGMEIDGRRIRVDFSITQRAHTPTPGIYMGKPTYLTDGRGQWGGRQKGDNDYYGGYRGGGGYRGRSPSPYYRRRRYERSRSRSYSPRCEARCVG